MDFEHILFEVDQGIARVTLNNPESLNALHLEMRAELKQALSLISEDDTIRTVVLNGAGRSFSSGGDIRTMEGVSPVDGRLRLKSGQKIIKAMTELEKPIIASIHGATAGAGASVALAADIIIAAEGTKILTPFVKIGLTPDWGLYYFLLLRVGLTRAKELLLTGDVIEAERAERIGLINRVVPPEKLVEETMLWATRFAQGPGQAYAMIKLALNRWPASLESLLELESAMQAVAFSSDDFDEGRRAFLEKRKPEFKGR
jgi:2-(1,2-epoxy-1,2-dihydrophenyl)acetyl-CoA isomerase